MQKTKSMALKLGLLLGIAASAASSWAMLLDADIIIRKALNSSNFHVKYTGAAAAMIELKLNGTSMGTVNVSPSKTSGEVEFALDLTALADGENLVVVNLFDRNGRLIGTQKATILAEDESTSPVKLTAPKMGSTVQGSVEIKVGFGKELKNVYVSFFVNDQFKALTNVAPYAFVWDTTAEPNGWHELQAWLVDSNSYTFKTRKIRVFVNNPGGRTNRTTVAPPPANLQTTGNPVVAPAVTNAASGVKTVPTNGMKTVANTVATTMAPTTTGLTTAANTVKTIVAGASGLKSAPGVSSTTDAKLVVPKLAPVGNTPKTLPVNATNLTVGANAARTISITKGQRLPNLGTFSVMLNSKLVSFDVQPRVENGIPITPFRHLIEEAGGKVDWEHLTKTLSAEAEGSTILVKIGDRIAKVNELPVELEIAPFIERGRTMVPLSFIKDSLQVDVEYDPKTGHVLITSIKKRD